MEHTEAVRAADISGLAAEGRLIFIGVELDLLLSMVAREGEDTDRSAGDREVDSVLGLPLLAL